MRIRSITVAAVAGLAVVTGAGVGWAAEPEGGSTVVRIVVDENGDAVSDGMRSGPCPDDDGGGGSSSSSSSEAQAPTETGL